MLKEEEWVSDREKSLAKLRFSQLPGWLSIIWLIGFAYLGPFLNISQYFGNYWGAAFYIFWIGPFMILLRFSSYLNVDFSASDKIAYHLYSVTRNLENLNELTTNTAEKDIQKHLKALDDDLRNNDLVEVDDLFTENILITLEDLLDSLERLNNYMKREKKPEEFNKKVALYLRVIADAMRNDNTKITPALSKHIEQLKQELEKIKPLKIRMPLHKKIYEETIKCWKGSPIILKISILSLLVAMCVFLVPEKFGFKLSIDTKAIISATFIAIIINPYVGKQK